MFSEAVTVYDLYVFGQCLQRFFQHCRISVEFLKQPKCTYKIESVAETLIGHNLERHTLADYHLATFYNRYGSLLTHGKEQTGISKIIQVMEYGWALYGLKIGHESRCVERTDLDD